MSGLVETLRHQGAEVRPVENLDHHMAVFRSLIKDEPDWARKELRSVAVDSWIASSTSPMPSLCAFVEIQPLHA
jgi:hypothetical protein